jgi:hypothetical protein
MSLDCSRKEPGNPVARARGSRGRLSGSGFQLQRRCCSAEAQGQLETYSGPRSSARRLLYNKTGSAVWYNGFDFLNPRPAELFNDAEFTPKMVAVAVVLTNEEILNNQGTNQLKT